MTHGTSSVSLRPGARLAGRGATFVLRTARALAVDLLLFDRPDDDQPAAEHALERRPGTDVWCAEVSGLSAGQLYVYRVRAEESAPFGDGWVLDPCARAVTFAGRRWGERTGERVGRVSQPGARFPKAALVDDRVFDWGADAPPRIPWADTILYELHVRGFTRGAGAGVRNPGTYEGLVERIPYLQDLGVTAVELMPVHEFDELEFFLEGGPRRDLLNYWGYSPLAFSAPMARYAADPDPLAAVESFKRMVKALHAAGIEVILDVVFNHTGEGNGDGPVYHFKRLDPAAYYLLQEDGRSFRDVTGCGNTLHANGAEAVDLIVDSLCAWVEHMHVDGFRFDLATALTRGPDGQVLDRPPLLDRIAAEPRLRGIKCIAEPWDAAGHHHGGRFPAPAWAEWNDRFRDDIRRFWVGHPGLLGAFATRLAGSSDLFEPAGRSPLHSLNYLACHDGFPLGDLVRYAHKHNEANGEENRDGWGGNFSTNYGVEGETDDPRIEARRERHLKNLLVTLFVAQGVPMLMAGDEFARTQQGNNNAYAQDNEVSWMDWTRLDRYRGLHAFARRLIAFRKARRSLRRNHFFQGISSDGVPPDIAWLGPDGQPPNWSAGVALACRIEGSAIRTGADRDEPSLVLAFNAGPDPVGFLLPDEPSGWRLAWATQDPAPGVPGPGEPFVLSGGSSAALESGT